MESKQNHYAIGDYALLACSATHRRPLDLMGLRPASGPRELRADARLEEPPAARPLWGRGSREWNEGEARHRSGQADVDVTE